MISNFNGNKISRDQFTSYIKNFNLIANIKLEPFRKDANCEEFISKITSSMKLFEIKSEQERNEVKSQHDDNEERLTELQQNDLLKSILTKSQIIPLKHYMSILSNLEDDLLSHEVDSLELYAITNVSELLTANLPANVFYKMFTKTSTNCFRFIDVIVQKLKENDQKVELTAPETVNFISKNFLNFNWLDQYLSSAVFFFDSSLASTTEFIKPINLTLKFYDDKLRSLHELSEFLWLNFSKLSQAGKNLELMEQKSIEYLTTFIQTIKGQHFENDQDIFMSYLVKKGFSPDLLTVLARYKSDFNSDAFIARKLELVTFGCMLVYLYSPIDPLDPLEYEQLIEKNRVEQIEIHNHEAHLNRINKYRLKEYIEEYKFDSELSEVFTERLKKADYFHIKNEFEINLKKFCGLDPLRKFINLFGRSGANVRQIDEEEFKIWLISLENFIQKLMSTFYSFTDIIYLPISGLSLVGYTINSLFTSWKSLTAKRNNQSANSLVKILSEYPYTKDHLTIASEISELTQAIQSEARLTDELNFVSLLHLVVGSRNKFKAVSDETESKHNELFLQLCGYFVGRYKAYKDMLAERENVETFKYKTYGQSEIEDELVQTEMEKEFPTFSHAFEEFLEVNLLDDKPAELIQKVKLMSHKFMLL